MWNYYGNESNDFLANNNNADPITNSESFKYKSNITGKANANQEDGENTETNNTKTKKNVEIVVPLKHLNNFWRILDMPFINCEVSLTLTWSENCVLSDVITQAARAAQGDNPARPEINAPTNATFKITDAKLYIPAVTLSTENNIRLLEQLRAGLKRTIKWNKYRSEMTNQTKNNNWNYLIDPRFTKVNRLSYRLKMKTTEHLFQSITYQKYCTPIDRKIFFDMPLKNAERTYKQIIEMGRNNDYRTLQITGL